MWRRQLEHYSADYQVGGTLIRGGRQAAIDAAIEWWSTACGTQVMDPSSWTEDEIRAHLPGWCVAPDGVDQGALDAEVVEQAIAMSRGGA